MCALRACFGNVRHLVHPHTSHKWKSPFWWIINIREQDSLLADMDNTSFFWQNRIFRGKSVIILSSYSLGSKVAILISHGKRLLVCQHTSFDGKFICARGVRIISIFVSCTWTSSAVRRAERSGTICQQALSIIINRR